jgi:hypothetical protein
MRRFRHLVIAKKHSPKMASYFGHDYKPLTQWPTRNINALWVLAISFVEGSFRIRSCQ